MHLHLKEKLTPYIFAQMYLEMILAERPFQNFVPPGSLLLAVLNFGSNDCHNITTLSILLFGIPTYCLSLLYGMYILSHALKYFQIEYERKWSRLCNADVI